MEDLAASDYPEATANQIIQFLTVFLKELAPSIDLALSEDELRFISHIIQEEAIYLQWLDNAHTAQTPRALAHLLTSLMNQMSPDSSVVVVPQADYNYSIRDEGAHLQQLVQDWIPKSRRHLFADFLKKPLKLISFPRIERDNLLSHAIFGHELGHPLADEFLIWEQAQGLTDAPQAAAHAEVLAFAQERVQKNPALKELDIVTRMMDQVLEIRKRAIQELVSDAIGVLIFGPSALFAMYEFLWDGNWDLPPQPEEWYPPSRLRIRVMLQMVESVGSLAALLQCKTGAMAKYMPAMEAFVDHARAIAAATDDDTAIRRAKHNQIAYDWALKHSLPAALEFAKAKVTPLIYDHAGAVAHLPEMLARLELGVPPNEVGPPLAPTTVDARSPLLAAWVYKLTGVDAQSGEHMTLKHVEKLNLQTLLATEYVLLRKKYDAHIMQEAALKAAPPVKGGAQ